MAKVVIPQVNLAPDFTAVVTGSHAGNDRVTSLHRWHQHSRWLALLPFCFFCLAGIGYEVSKYLALLGARVVLACENETRAKAVSDWY